MARNEVSIIIVTFNSEKHITKCLDSIKESDIDKERLKIIIVDNCSSDKTIKKVKKFQKKIRAITIIENKRNVGFARAVNQGIKENQFDPYFLLLNPDTTFEKKSLTNLIICSKKNDAGICGGKTTNIQGMESGSYFRFPTLMVGIFDFTNFRKLSGTDRWHKYFYYLDKNNKKKESFSVDVVTGGYMLIRSDTIQKIGLLDETFFMYLEDVDYCLRANKAGIKIYHSNSAIIQHIGGASSNNKDKIRHSSWLKSRKIYFIKHFGILANLLIQPLFLIDDILILTLKFFRK